MIRIQKGGLSLFCIISNHMEDKNSSRQQKPVPRKKSSDKSSDISVRQKDKGKVDLVLLISEPRQNDNGDIMNSTIPDGAEEEHK